nr:MAG TPA: hypothetical protein [Caudoviricetes sp.]
MTSKLNFSHNFPSPYINYNTIFYLYCQYFLLIIFNQLFITTLYYCINISVIKITYDYYFIIYILPF